MTPKELAVRALQENCPDYSTKLVEIYRKSKEEKMDKPKLDWDLWQCQQMHKLLVAAMKAAQASRVMVYGQMNKADAAVSDCRKALHAFETEMMEIMQASGLKDFSELLTIDHDTQEQDNE